MLCASCYGTSGLVFQRQRKPSKTRFCLIFFITYFYNLFFMKWIWCLLHYYCVMHATHDGAVLAVIILSLCSSVYLLHVCFVTNQTMHCGYFDTTRNGNHSNFLTLTVVLVRCPFLSEICTQSDPPLQKMLTLINIRSFWKIDVGG